MAPEQGLNLANPAVEHEDEVEILLGASEYDIIFGGKVQKLDNNTAMYHSLLGAVIIGKEAQGNGVKVNVAVAQEESLQSMERFWEIPLIKGELEEKDETAAMFQKTHKRVQGIYLVKLPFKRDRELGESAMRAKARFYQLERKLARIPKMKAEYIRSMQEYLDLRHMVPIEEGQAKYFIPHHAVVKEESLTTKMRTVFDASMKTTNDRSLNDILHTGPKLQSDISAVLLNFRLKKVAVTVDIEKMFRQILMDEDDQRYQCIWWRDDERKPLLAYKLTRVSFGTAPAPCLANMVMRNIEETVKTTLPLASKVLKRDST